MHRFPAACSSSNSKPEPRDARFDLRPRPGQFLVPSYHSIDRPLDLRSPITMAAMSRKPIRRIMMAAGAISFAAFRMAGLFFSLDNRLSQECDDELRGGNWRGFHRLAGFADRVARAK
jgi:hypothetical protein